MDMADTTHPNAGAGAPQTTPPSLPSFALALPSQASSVSRCRALPDCIWAETTNYLTVFDLRCLNQVSQLHRNLTSRRLVHASQAFRNLTCGTPPEEMRETIDNLAVQKLINPGVAGVAGFLRRTHNILHPKVIGALLSPLRPSATLSSDDAWTAAMPLMQEYMAGFDFAEVHIVDALINVLLRTSIPNSTRAVSFVLKGIARRFMATAVDACPGSTAATNFDSLDSAYLTLYSCFILNGDIRNPRIKKHHRMTKERFIGNHVGVAAMATVTPEYLGSIYDKLELMELPLRGWKSPVPAPPAATSMTRVKAALSSTARSLWRVVGWRN